MPFPGGKIFRNDYFYRHLNSDLFATISGNLMHDLKANLIIGNNIYDKNTTSNFVQGSNLSFPDFYNLSVANDVITRESTTKFRTIAYYLSATFDYKSYLFLTLTGREEGVSSLPEKNNYAFYPSANVAWIFTENVLKGNKILPYGKSKSCLF